jgi:DUF3102 family protein
VKKAIPAKAHALTKFANANVAKGDHAMADAINAAHAEAEKSLRASVEHAIHAGELLIKVKLTVPHGEWIGWLTDNIDFSERLAQAYMRLAKMPPEKRNAVADLPLREALSAIRCREKKMADQARAASSGPARLVVGTAAIDAEPLPPSPPATARDIADDLVSQLVEGVHEMRDRITFDDVYAALDRRGASDDYVNVTPSAEPGVPEIPGDPEKRTHGLPAGSVSLEIPAEQVAVARTAQPDDVGDLVDQAFCLVLMMTRGQRERFCERMKDTYPELMKPSPALTDDIPPFPVRTH